MALQQWKIGEKKGDSKSSMALFNIEMEADLNQIEPLNKNQKLSKKSK